MNSFLEVEDLYVEFAGKRRFFGQTPPPIKAVNGVTFTIEAGTTFGLVGESGSGKSTIARAILRLVNPQRGSIRVADKEATTLSGNDLFAYRRQVQVVFQDPYSSLNPSKTIGHIVGELITRHRGIKGKERVALVRELLEKVGLGSHFLERYPYELSGGQRQRVAIARALSVEPQMIICDEATSALDVSVQSQVINLLEEIQKQTGIAYLFITHDLAVVQHISHHIGVMYLGFLVETGPADRVYTAPAHPYTEMLLTAVPVPHPATQRQRARERRAVTLNVEPPSPADLPKGCPFANRCALVMDICHEELPGETAVVGGGTVRCHLHTSGPSLNGQSLIPLLQKTSPQNLNSQTRR
jgi:peptide/nickel transport system ATP-binding protein